MEDPNRITWDPRSWTLWGIVWWTIGVWGPLALTLACGAMLLPQQKSFAQRNLAYVAQCNEVAREAQERAAEKPGDVAKAPESERAYGTMDLAPELRDSPAARGAYANCMEE